MNDCLSSNYSKQGQGMPSSGRVFCRNGCQEWCTPRAQAQRFSVTSSCPCWEFGGSSQSQIKGNAAHISGWEAGGEPTKSNPTYKPINKLLGRLEQENAERRGKLCSALSSGLSQTFTNWWALNFYLCKCSGLVEIFPGLSSALLKKKLLWEITGFWTCIGSLSLSKMHLCVKTVAEVLGFFSFSVCLYFIMRKWFWGKIRDSVQKAETPRA